jgi:hypothetical protein
LALSFAVVFGGHEERRGSRRDVVRVGFTLHDSEDREDRVLKSVAVVTAVGDYKDNPCVE